MPRHCSAGGCKSRDNRETRNAGVTFHKLPKGTTRRNLWITNSHRSNSWDPQTDFVYFCSKHFTPESFELTNYSGIRRLKEDALPTVFHSSATKEPKPADAARKQEDVPVSFCYASQEQDKVQHSEESTLQWSVPPSGKTPDPKNAFPAQETVQQEHAPSPPSESQPPSPSRYMRRLPPPPGFYLSKEHNYAQLYPLLWRRRYDQIVDCLEKALRQLHATRRRENRLRSTVLRLRDKQLRHTLSQDGSRGNGSWAPAGGSRVGKGNCYQEDSETEVKSDDACLFEERCVDQMDLKENRHCFYCGRGRVKTAGQEARGLSRTYKDVWLTEHERVQLTSRDHSVVAQGDELENSLNISDSKSPDSHGTVQSTNPQELTPAGMLLSTAYKQRVGFQKLRVSDVCEEQCGTVSPKDQPYLQQQQQLLWVQESSEEQVVLLPASVKVDLQNFHATDSQAVLVSEVEVEDTSGGALPERPHGSADVREKLKEHLEGFHLQLSSEFIN